MTVILQDLGKRQGKGAHIRIDYKKGWYEFVPMGQSWRIDTYFRTRKGWGCLDDSRLVTPAEAAQLLAEVAPELAATIV